MDLSPKVIETKAKIDKWDLVKLEHFSTAKETIIKKKQSTELEKIFANNMYKGIISKIYKWLIWLNRKKFFLIG